MKSVNPYLAPRNKMVLEQIVGRGVRDPQVLAAIRNVAREAFVEEDLRRFAYADEPLPIGEGRRSRSPTYVAAMTEALRLQGRRRHQ